MTHYEPIIKNTGVNASEKYLSQLCEKTFLSLWSYPSVFRKEGSHKKEISDVLVVYEDNVVIFSDKHIDLDLSDNHKVVWDRFYKKAILNSAKQLWGAERWIKQNLGDIYIDKDCSTKLPLDIDLKNCNIYLVAVARGVSKHVKSFYGNASGSLILNYSSGMPKIPVPYVVDDIDVSKTFVHIFDEVGLDLVLNSQDTVVDLITYLSERQRLFRSGAAFMVTGEEELLADFMTHVDEVGTSHSFSYWEEIKKGVNAFMVPEGGWYDFINSEEFKSKIADEEISYFWDDLIEKFSKHALDGTQYLVEPKKFSSSEQVVRVMARANRFKRKYYSKAFKGILEKSEESPDLIQRRFLFPFVDSDPHYVFICFPVSRFGKNHDEYRRIRANYLRDYCFAIKAKFQDVKEVIGIAVEAGALSKRATSEDAVYLDCTNWSSELQKQGEQIIKNYDLFKNVVKKHTKTVEFPKLDDVHKHM